MNRLILALVVLFAVARSVECGMDRPSDYSEGLWCASCRVVISNIVQSLPRTEYYIDYSEYAVNDVMDNFCESPAMQNTVGPVKYACRDLLSEMEIEVIKALTFGKDKVMKEFSPQNDPNGEKIGDAICKVVVNACPLEDNEETLHFKNLLDPNRSGPLSSMKEGRNDENGDSDDEDEDGSDDDEDEDESGDDENDDDSDDDEEEDEDDDDYDEDEGEEGEDEDEDEEDEDEDDDEEESHKDEL